MGPVVSFSSQMMTDLLAPWQYTPPGLVARVINKIVCEILLVSALEVALIEGTVRIFALPGLLVLHTFTNIPVDLKNFYNKLGSAWFTVAWATADLVLNFFYETLAVHESEARCFVGCKWVFRQEDRQFLQSRLARQAQLRVREAPENDAVQRAIALSLEQRSNVPEHMIQEGANLLIQVVTNMYQNWDQIKALHNHDTAYEALTADDLKEKFIDADEGSFILVLTEVVRYYVTGEGKDIKNKPCFLIEDTWQKVCHLRTTKQDAQIELKKVAHSELQGILVKKCWMKAIGEIDAVIQSRLVVEKSASLIKKIMEKESVIFGKNLLVEENPELHRATFTSSVVLRMIEYYVSGEGAKQKEAPIFLTPNIWQDIIDLRKDADKSKILGVAFKTYADITQRELFELSCQKVLRDGFGV